MTTEYNDVLLSLFLIINHKSQTIVLVVDSGEGFNKKMIPTNVINLNIGKNVDLQLPPQFWLRLTNKLGTVIKIVFFRIFFIFIFEILSNKSLMINDIAYMIVCVDR
jgi:hypothetical protein